jgi:hypothetical protein
MTFKPALFAAMLMFIASAAHAQTQAPGLWEHRFAMKSQDGQIEAALVLAQQQLAALPPEQRRKLEAMLASRGIQVDAQATTAQFCLTPEQAAKPPEPRLTGDCTRQELTRNGNTLKYRFECTTPQPVQGEGELTFVDARTYRGSSTVTSQLAGQARRMNLEMSGRWLSADCGAVKPLALPAQ